MRPFWNRNWHENEESDIVSDEQREMLRKSVQVEIHRTNIFFHFTWILLLLLIFDLWVFQPLQYVVFLNIGVVVGAFLYVLVKRH